MTTLASSPADTVTGAAPLAAVTDAEPAIHAHGVCVTFPTPAGRVEALRAVELEVRAGQVVSVMGESGSGKTTLLACLSGRLSPDAGRIRCSGTIAVIHQDLRLVKQRSALQNVLCGCLGRQPLHRTMFGFPPDERRRAMGLLDRVGLSGRARCPVGRMSGGEQQRVAIARALMQDPDVLLADEPVAALDDTNARLIMELLHSLARERKITLVSVLHDPILAAAFADRVVILDRGRVAMDTTCQCSHAGAEELACQAGCLARAISGVACSSGTGDVSMPGIPRRQPACSLEDSLARYRSTREQVSPMQEPPATWRRPLAFGALALIAVLVYGWAAAGMDVSSRQWRGSLPGLGRFLAALVPHSWQDVRAIPWRTLGGSLLETIQMSLLGTTAAIVIAWPLAALAAKNVGPRGVPRFMRLLLNGIRTVPAIIWALFFVAAVGIGPLAGVLALTFYSVGYLSKFFYEAFESVDPAPGDALRAIGASGPQCFLHAVWPAARPAVLSMALFMVEYNVREASVLGIVGAGGIGYYIKQFIDWRDFPAALAGLGLLLVIVIMLDAISTRMRARLVRV